MLGIRRPHSLALLLVLLTASGCGSDPSLLALEKDPMASLVVSGTHLEYEAKDRGGTALGKPVHAHITRQFSLDTVAAEDAVGEAAHFASAHGWAPETARATSLSASKQIGEIRAELRVTVAAHNGTDALYVYLTAF